MFHDSIYNNIVLGKKDISPDDFIKVCEMTGVSEFVNNYPEGYDYVLSDNGKNLSGGQRRKIALARALLCNTEMFIFDESTNNLDEDSERRFLEIIERYLIGKTIIFISHNNVFDKYVNKIYRLERGELLPC